MKVILIKKKYKLFFGHIHIFSLMFYYPKKGLNYFEYIWDSKAIKGL